MLYNRNWDVKVPDLTKPSLEGLAYLLRRKDLWPKGFKWDWSHPNCCGMGLTMNYWKLSCCKSDYIAQVFNISYVDVYKIFLTIDIGEAPPESVAERIEKYLGQHR